MTPHRLRQGGAATTALILLLAAISFMIGGYFPANSPVPMEDHSAHGATPVTKKATTWTCSMHPQIRLPSPGQCPICAMDLIPLDDGGDDGETDPSIYQMSKSARAMAQIETVAVERREVTREVRMVGKVVFDETRVQDITARFPGRLDRLYVDFTGVPVQLGDHLADIYSPEILTAQQELLQAIQASRDIHTTRDSFLKRTTEATVEATREKLRLWGLTTAQIRGIEQDGKISDHLTLYAYQAGIVVQKHAVEGAYVKEGEKIYTIADLTQVWVNLDAYESDISWIRYGQEVTFETEAFPGEVFEGRISFIHPVMDEQTRTIKLRVNVPNLHGRLKPGMFVRARVMARLMGKGTIYDRTLAGKWIGPMHPEIVKDAPGLCDICKMPLVKADSLGFVGKPVKEELPLVVPVSAVLRTGKRALVYVELPDRKKPTYQGRVVTLGPRAGDFYILRSGIQAGERVVAQGNFKIDSAVQILAGPSMMTLPSEGEESEVDLRGTTFGMASRGLVPLVDLVAHSIHANDPDAASEAFQQLATATEKLPMSDLEKGAKAHAKHLLMLLKQSAKTGAEAWELPEAQEAFLSFNKTLRDLLPPERPDEEDRNLIGQVRSFSRQLAAFLASDDLQGSTKLISDTKLPQLMVPQKGGGSTFSGERWQLLLILRRLESSTQNLEDLRSSFALLAEELVTLARQFPELSKGGRLLFCPMAFDGRGAKWLQDDGPVANPYFGNAMLRCGEDFDLQAKAR